MYDSVIVSSLNTVAAIRIEAADAPRQDGREEIHQRAGDGSLIRARASHHQLLEKVSLPTRMRCCMSATSGCVWALPWAGFISEKIAPVTVIMMAVETSSSMIEYPASLVRERPAGRRHDAFLVLTVTSSASPAIRVRVNADCVRAASLTTGVTSTWMTSVLFGLVGSG